MSAARLLAELRGRLEAEDRLLVAFSGGVDSALLAAVAADVLGPEALAVTAVSPSLAPEERRGARAFARRHDVRHLEIATDEEDRDEYRANGADRCYHCKSALFDALDPLAEMLGARVALGTITDDLGDERPGLQAASERGAIAPLAEVGFTKADVRAVSMHLGLETAEKPAAACLASRVAYGDPVDAAVLARIARAESAIRALGFADLRVRSHGGGTLARVEVPEDQWEKAVTHRHELRDAALEAGFDFATLDLASLRSGSMNVLLRNRRPVEPDARVDLGYATVDLDRRARQGVAEVVYAPGKRPEEIAGIVEALLAGNEGPVLVTRVGEEDARAVRAAVPGATHDRAGRVLAWRPRRGLPFRLAVVTAGTTDETVAAEATATARALGLQVERVDDVGVAGLHRLMAVEDRLHQADALIVVAGMEGALASVVGGLIGGPVIAVPTSIGYGATFEGVTALLAMLSSCAPGISVVNVDNGYGAAMAAYRLARSAGRAP